jgi:methylglutaconyl-CoA hydratase
LVNYCVPQNDAGDAAFQKSLEVAQQILPNGPVAVKMAKAAINKGMQVQKTEG